MSVEKKVLIWYPISELAPVGGPAGYLYNLKEKLNGLNIKVEFLPGSTFHARKKNRFKKFIRNKLKFSLDIVTIKKIMKATSMISIDINQYDAIHFHSTKDLYHARNIIKSYKGKLILTSHSPKPLYQEIIDDVLKMNDVQKKIFGRIIEEFSEIDKYAFQKADFLMFPCKEAEEPYINNWDWYKEFSLKNREKFIYIPSCTNVATYKINKKEILNRYGIPKKSKVVCYVGRHNVTKGFDKLKKIGKSILDNNKDVYFIIAGKEEPIKGLNHPRWIEVGWTNDPHSIINACDVFILPNKETYFDLILLEILSLSKPVLLSNTGGNKYFKQFSKTGMKYYNNEDEATSRLSKLLQLSKSELNDLGEMNLNLFNKNFRTEIFIKRYEEILKNII